MYSKLPPFQVHSLVGLEYIYIFENTTVIKVQISMILKLCPCCTAIPLSPTLGPMQPLFCFLALQIRRHLIDFCIKAIIAMWRAISLRIMILKFILGMREPVVPFVHELYSIMWMDHKSLIHMDI